jgi:hypothetical protein
MTDLTYVWDGEIQEVVRKFERCEFAPEEFTHARHLTVACWYLCTMPPDAALSQMRAGLQQFIAHHGKQGKYHETITRFWMELLSDFLAGQPPLTPLIDKVNKAVKLYGTKEVLFAYYTRERALSEAAKREWLEPDLRALREHEVR